MDLRRSPIQTEADLVGLPGRSPTGSRFVADLRAQLGAAARDSLALQAEQVAIDPSPTTPTATAASATAVGLDTPQSAIVRVCVRLGAKPAHRTGDMAAGCRHV